MSLWDKLGEGPTTNASHGSDSSQTSTQQTGTQNRGATSAAGASTAQSNIADWARPYAQDALAMGRGVSQQQFEKYDPSGVSRYSNPYTAAVLEPTLRNINEGAANEMAGISSTARNLGAFGGSRQAVLEAKADENRLQAIGDATAKANSDAYNQALNIDLGEFNREQNWDSNRLRDYLGAVSGVPIDRSTTTQDVSSQANLSEIMQLMNSEQDSTERGFGTETSQASDIGTLGGIAGLIGTIGGIFSDEKMKTAKRKVSGKEILAMLDEIEPGQEWEYKHDRGTKRVGPMAQDLEKYAGVGNGRVVPPNEVASLSLAAVKALRDEMHAAKA